MTLVMGEICGLASLIEEDADSDVRICGWTATMIASKRGCLSGWNGLIWGRKERSAMSFAASRECTVLIKACWGLEIGVVDRGVSPGEHFLRI